MKINCVLFDLDGTLLNTNNLVIQSFKHTFNQHLDRVVLDEELFPYFGVPLVTIMEHFDPKQVDQMLRTYRSFNLQKHDELTTVFPNVEGTLRELSKQGVKLGIVTSKIRNVVTRGLQLFSLESFFDTVVTFEDTEAHKPNPAPINKALADLQVSPEEGVLMVGDSPFDLQCAANAGVCSAAVAWSVHSLDELKQHKPDYILDKMEDLLPLTSAGTR